MQWIFAWLGYDDVEKEFSYAFVLSFNFYCCALDGL